MTVISHNFVLHEHIITLYYSFWNITSPLPGIVYVTSPHSTRKCVVFMVLYSKQKCLSWIDLNLCWPMKAIGNRIIFSWNWKNILKCLLHRSQTCKKTILYIDKSIQIIVVTFNIRGNNYHELVACIVYKCTLHACNVMQPKRACILASATSYGISFNCESLPIAIDP